MKNEVIYKILFLNHDQIYELYAKQIFESSLNGFIEIEEFIFNNNAQILIDTNEEKLKKQFKNIIRSFVPYHSIIRIDEVDSIGKAEIIKKIPPTSNTNKINLFKKDSE